LDKPDEAQRLLAWAKGKSSEFLSLTLQARTLQSQGKLQLSSEVTQQALEMERNQKLDETAWSDLGQLAMVQADFGVCDQARKNAATIPAGKTQNADVFAGFAFATCGDAAKSEALASELGKNYPLNTLIQKLGIPQIRARIELQRGNSAKAIEKLRPSEAYQLGYIADGKPVYLRGLAYLQAKQGPQAVTEFQKVIDHKAAFGASPNVSLAQLGLARALVLSGDSAKARIVYQDSSPSGKRRSRHPHPERNQGGVREAEVAASVLRTAIDLLCCPT
jgi:eukaryotic-like serine/threonine-protein kinase